MKIGLLPGLMMLAPIAVSAQNLVPPEVVQLDAVMGWSLTMYDENMLFVANPLSRYSISPRQNLKFNPDGSIDLYLQNSSPGTDKETNWLPAPAGKFVLMLRMYWPNEESPSILTGTWTIPAVKRAS